MTHDLNDTYRPAPRTRRRGPALLAVVVAGAVLAACGPMGTTPDPDPAPFTETAIGLAADGTTLARVGAAGTATWPVEGLMDGTRLVAIDHRASDGLLYGLGDDGTLYAIDADAMARAVGAAGAYGDLTAGAAIDVNPQVDALRVLTTADGRNFVTNLTFGTAAEFTTSAYAAGDANAGTTPMVVATAYTTNVAPFPDGAETVQYSLESEANVLAVQGKNMGTLTTVAELDVDVTALAGLDVSGPTGMAYALLGGAADAMLYAIDLASGDLTALDADVSGWIDLTIVPGGTLGDAPTLDEMAVGLTDDGLALRELSAMPSTATPITGLNADTALLAIDHRPASDALVALGDDGQLYDVALDGAATAIGTPQTYGDLSAGVAFDVNAQVDAIRVVLTADGRNFVTNATTGATTEFTASAFADGDAGDGTAPMVVATGYDLSLFPFPDGEVTTQYSLDAATDVLAIQGKNAGTLTTVAPLGVAIEPLADLDVSGATGDAYALIGAAGAWGLFAIDVETAALTRLAVDADGLRSFAIVPE